MKTTLMYVFFVVSTVALLPSWLFAAVLWRRNHGIWVWVNPSEYARCAYLARDWVLVVINNVWWVLIIAVITVLKVFF